MVPLPRRLTLAACIVLLGGCGTRQGVATRPVAPAQAVLPSGATGAPDGPGTLTVGELQRRLMAHADRALGEVARAATAARLRDSSPEARALTQQIQAEVGTTAVALAVSPDPEAALLDLMVSSAAQALALTRPPGAKALGDAARAPLEQALGRLEREAWSLGARVYGPDELQALHGRVVEWSSSQAGAAFPGVVRAAELPGGRGGPAAKGLFAPIEEATRQIEEGRLLGERFLFLAQRLPVLSRWQAEALSWEAMNTPEARQSLASLAVISASMARLSAQVESLPATVRIEREALLAAFDAREGAMRSLLGTARDAAADGRALAASGERVLAASEKTAASIHEAIRAADRLVASLRDPRAPGGAASLDIERYTTALHDLRGAAEALNAAATRGEGLTGAGRALVDHAAWRVAQLLVLLFLLLLGFRWLGPRLGGRPPG